MVIVQLNRKRDVRGLKEPALSVHTMKLTTKVSYLLPITDKGLTWEAQLKKW